MISSNLRLFLLQRIVRMNKTEDDELDAEELTEDEIREVTGDISAI